MSFAMQFDMRCHSPAPSATEEAARQVENVGDEIRDGEQHSALSTPVNAAAVAATTKCDSRTIVGNDNGVCSRLPACTETVPFTSLDCRRGTKPQRRNGPTSPFTLLTNARRLEPDGTSCHSAQPFDDNYSSDPGGRTNQYCLPGAVTQTYANECGMHKRQATVRECRSQLVDNDVQSFVNLHFNDVKMSSGDDSFYMSYIANESFINPDTIEGFRQYFDTSLLNEQDDQTDLKRKRRAQEIDVSCGSNSLSQLHQIASEEGSSSRLSGQPVIESKNMQLVGNLTSLNSLSPCSNSNQFCASVNSLQSMDTSSARGESNMEINAADGCSKVGPICSRLWPCQSAKLKLVMNDPSLRMTSNSSHAYDDADLQLPRSVINKLVKDAAGRIRVSAEAREVFVGCCHEFVKVLGALANLSCEENRKKLIGPDHVMAALTEMGLDPFRPACQEIMNTLQEEAAQKRKRMTLCYDGDDFTTDKLLKEQQKLFEQARKEQFADDPDDPDDDDSSDESLKDGRIVQIGGVNYRIPKLQPVMNPYADEDDYD